MNEWSDDELRATVRSYLAMLAAQTASEGYSKAEFRRRLLEGPVKGRSGPALEYRMRNISAVMEAHGRPIVKGYLPAKNVGRDVLERLWAIVQEVPKGDRPPMVYFNIGWMNEYQGPNEPTSGGFAYLKKHEHGWEAFNFLEVDGVVRGYRPGQRVSIERLGAPRTAEKIEGVLVVWMAREPKSRQALIVGWYENATVYRSEQLPKTKGRKVDGNHIGYTAIAQASDAKLIPTGARQFRVESKRTATEGFGQSPTWYGSDAVNERVWGYVQSIGRPAPAARKLASQRRSTRPPRNPDPELRRKVEKAAVDHATAFYRSEAGGRCEVESVEILGRGWDLEVVGEGVELLVEVKGLQGTSVICELTPNEYEKMISPDNRDRYVVYVVSNALEAPIASVFHHVGEGEWKTQDNRRLEIVPRTGAVLRAK